MRSATKMKKLIFIWRISYARDEILYILPFSQVHFHADCRSCYKLPFRGVVRMLLLQTISMSEKRELIELMIVLASHFYVYFHFTLILMDNRFRFYIYFIEFLHFTLFICMKIKEIVLTVYFDYRAHCR